MSLPRYTEYKDSGILWVGPVPAHWSVQPLLGVANERFEPNTGMPEDNLLSLSYGRIVRKDIESNDGLLPESFETYQIIHQGDIVLRLTDLQNDKRSLRSAQVQERGIITSAYLALKPSGTSSAFLAYLLRAYDLGKVFYSMGGGLRQSMKFSDLKRMPIAIPSESEQTAIAAFLDRETAKIDALVAEQEKLIALLAEKRQATISHAVTRGLNPHAPMKDSGVAWLGEVPAHWEARKFGHIVFLQEGPGLRHWQFTDDGVRVICVTNITDKGIDFAKLEKYISHEEYESSYTHFTVQQNDLLLSSSGNSWGKVAKFDSCEKVILNTSTIRINAGESAFLNQEFIKYLLQSTNVREQLELFMTGACQPNFGPTHLSQVQVCIPPFDEQESIARFLDLETDRLSKLSGEAIRAIELFQERRSALIAAAVTGQIDVRGAA